jgi:pSer/pThr/pTyr-binding forkhead associated (FHA) protein
MSASNDAMLFLTPLNGTFEEKVLQVPLHPEVMKISRQTNVKTTALPANGHFDSKVLSRQHAEIWADGNGKIWIRDTKSTNGTFINGQRLSVEKIESNPQQLRKQDILELGVDVVDKDSKSIIYHKVVARVEQAGLINIQLGDGKHSKI